MTILIFDLETTGLLPHGTPSYKDFNKYNIEYELFGYHLNITFIFNLGMSQH